MWEINNNLQILGFVRSVVLGCIFCTVYDILRSFRKTVSCSDLAVFWQDIIYFALCAPVSFCFLLAVTNGELRAYVFLGIALGFAVFRFTLSFVILRILCFCFMLFKKLYSIFSKLLTTVFLWVNKFFSRIIRIFYVFLKKVINSFKKVLKKQ